MKILAFLFLFSTFSLAAQETVIRIFSDHEAGKVNALIFGHNIEAGDTRGLDNAKSLQWPKPPSEMVDYGQGNWNPAFNAPNSAALKEYAKVGCRLLRYPGGCIAHNFDWRMAVGKREERPNWKFGLNEYLTLCCEIKAEPMITLTDYAFPPEDLPQHCAQLVEYLNMPAEPQYPMAMKRTRDGYPNPWNVKYFEFGNESFHPNHSSQPFRAFSAQDYAATAKKVFAAIRKVDPSVQLGAVAMNGMDFSDAENPWIKTIFTELIPVADFIVIHYYGPRFEKLSCDQALEAFLTGQSLFQYRLLATRQLMRQYGGKELPLSLSEFNIKAIENAEPHWRHTYLAGLAITDLLMAMRRPASGLHSAAYWQFIGGYFGSVQTQNGHWNYDAVYPFLCEFAGTVGDALLEVSVQNNPRQEQPAKKLGAVAASGSDFQAPKPLGPVKNFRFFDPALKGLGIQSKLGETKGLLKFSFNDLHKDAYPCFMGMRRPSNVPFERGYSLLLTFESRYIPDANRPDSGTFTLGFGLMDARGWQATQCAAAESGLQKDSTWETHTIRLGVGADCNDIFGLLRASDFNGSCNGTLEIRNLSGEIIADCVVPAVELLAVEASRKQSGENVLAVINRSAALTIPATIVLSGSRENHVTIRELYNQDVTRRAYFEPTQSVQELKAGEFKHSFPPHSLTLFTFSSGVKQ